MSTLPGHDTWRDAGVEEPDRREREVREIDPDDVGTDEPDERANLLEQALAGGRAPGGGGEDYRPTTARPDLEGTADEADVAEQADEVRGLDEEDAYSDEPDEGPEEPDEDVED
ncbi:MAG: hypothetical protein FWF90_00100 [Promicromonosporaceae bacterium]|nr:hypothetical protein [Promicromonosporaceae bacterium]